MIVKVTVERGMDDFFVARCPSLRSCCSQGKTREEALENIREAIALYLEPEPADVDPISGREVVDLTL